MKMWILNDRVKPIEIKQVSVDRLVDGLYAPPGMARYNYRKKPGKDEYVWDYVYVGSTRDIVVDKYNERFKEEIAQLEAKITGLKEKMAK